MKNFFKGKAATTVIILATVILAGVAIFTAVRLYQLRQTSVAPNVPESQPEAAVSPPPGGSQPSPPPGGGNPSPPPSGGSCSLSFTLAGITSPPPGNPTPPPVVIISPTAGPLSCPATNPSDVEFKWNTTANAATYYLRIDDTTSSTGFTPCGTGAILAGDFCIPGITATTYTKSLPAGHSYKWWVSGFTSAGVQGVNGSPLAFTIPAVCASSSPTPTATPTATPQPTGTPNSCGGSCGSNFNCASNLVCYNSFCRNPSCTSNTDCNCGGTSTATSTATPGAAASLPSSGTDWPTILGVWFGAAVVLGSLLLAL